MNSIKKGSALIVFLLLFSVTLLGCGSKNTGESNNSSSKVDLEILSWWTAGGEADALDAVLKGFNEKYPDINVKNAAVAGGGGSNAQTVLSTRLQGGDPPAVFQAQGGPDLLRWQDAEYLESLTDLYRENGFQGVIPNELIQMNTIDNEIYGIPINIHRNNVIWYNKKIFDEFGLQPPKSMDEFFTVAEALTAKGVTPLALGDKNPRWGTLIFDIVLLDVFGADDIAKLWTGEVDFDSPQMREAVNVFSKVLSYTNKNHSALDWQDAAELVVSGEAAMHIMGDWESGFFVSKNLKPNVDFGWAPTPSKEKIFNIVNDSMAMPKGVKNKDAAKKLVEYLGSAEAQQAFNKLKGSIPARTDVDVSDFSEYSQSAAKDFKDSRIVLSLAGGSATSAGFINKVDEAVNIFTTQKDANAFIELLNQARSHLKG